MKKALDIPPQVAEYMRMEETSQISDKITWRVDGQYVDIVRRLERLEDKGKGQRFLDRIVADYDRLQSGGLTHSMREKIFQAVRNHVNGPIGSKIMSDLENQPTQSQSVIPDSTQ